MCVLCMPVDVYILKWNLTSLVRNKKTMWFITALGISIIVINMI